MKRILSLFLCVLMCLSIFSATASQVYAIGNTAEIFKVSTDGFADDEITYTISLAAGQTKVTGVIVQAAFDSSALEVDVADGFGNFNADGDFVYTVPGVYETGLTHDDNGVYSLAYMSATGYTTSKDVALFSITFKAISEERRPTSVEFVCIEIETDDGDDNNDITKTDGIQTITTSTFDTLSQPKVSEVNSVEGGLKVRWSKSTGAESYTLYRKTADTEWAVLDNAIDGTATEYNDLTVQQGTEYYYTVSAKNSYAETAYDVTGVAGMNFGSISSISATAASTGAYITWSALQGAEKYEVMRKLSSSDNWQLVTTTTQCEYLDESVSSGVSYDYRVRAIQGKYAAGMAVDPVSFKYIATPVVYVQNINGGIEVSFDEVGGADKYIVEKSVNGGEYTLLAELLAADEEFSFFDENVVAEGVYSYKVQAVSTVDGLSGEKVTTDAIVRLGMPAVDTIENSEFGVVLTWSAVKNAEEYTIYSKGLDGIWKVVGKTTNTKYTDTAAESGRQYTYAVSATNATGESGFTDSKSISYLATPEIVSVSNVEDGIKVVWKVVDGAVTYNIYRAKVNSDNWTKIGWSSVTSYVDTEAAKGEYYKYTVMAVNGEAESAYNLIGVEGMYFGTITSVSASISPKGVNVYWNRLDDATSYEVYRKTGTTNSWNPIARVEKGKEIYEDTNVSSGVTYYYMVKAYSGNNVAETTADPASIKYISAPVHVVKNVKDGLRITINPVAGAEKYSVYKKNGLQMIPLATFDASTTTYTDTEVVPGSAYYYEVYALAGDIESMPYSVGYITRFGAPKNVAAKNLLPGVQVSWDAVDDAVEYEIYRKEGNQAEWGEPIAVVSGTSYIDGTVWGNEYYQYTVSAVSADGGNSGYDDDGFEILFLETPDLTSVVNVSGGLKFTWEPVDGATGYRVYRKESGKGWVILHENFTGTVYTDKTAKSGVNYTYTVRALNGEYESYFDSGVKGIYLPAPTVKIANTASGVKVSWTKVPGATHYRVFRKVGTGSWVRVTDLKSSYTSYTDKASNKYSGKKCAYTVKPYYSPSKTWGTYKSSAGLLVLSTPTVTVSNATSGVTIKWTKVPGATHYRIYRKASGGSWTVVKDLKSSYTSYTDTAVKKSGGKTYYYTVKPYHSSTKTWGAFKSSSAIVRLLTPTLKSAVSSKTGITVTWGKVTGASGYIVYRKTTGGWSKIATVTGNSKVKYVDKTAKKGTTYKYTVRAFYGSAKAPKSTSYFNTSGIACKDRY